MSDGRCGRSKDHVDGGSVALGLLVGAVVVGLVGQCSVLPLKEDKCHLQFELAQTARDTVSVLSDGTGRACLEALRADRHEMP